MRAEATPGHAPGKTERAGGPRGRPAPRAQRARRARLLAAFALSALSPLFPLRALAAPPAAPAAARPVDRVVARFWAPELGGPERPRVVFERELAFEARLEALADPDGEARSYGERHVRAALDRHVAEVMLEVLSAKLRLTPKEIADRAEAARSRLELRIGGRAALERAALAEGISEGELAALHRRKARASLYLDRMLAPLLDPSEHELREALQSGATPFGERPYEEVAPLLKRWYVSERIAQAIAAFYQSARLRVMVKVVPGR